jgi:nitrate reductase delta subunit
VSTGQGAVSPYKLASVLLQYPTAALFDGMNTLDAAAAQTSPKTSRDAFARFLGWLRATPPTEVGQHYLETFDLRRRCAPYLSYYRYGDTRKRGMSMLTFKTAYRVAGWQPSDDDLPDYLPMVLDFATLTPRAEVLRAHRADVELLRRALEQAGTLYVDVVAVFRAPPSRRVPRPVHQLTGCAVDRARATHLPAARDRGVDDLGAVAIQPARTRLELPAVVPAATLHCLPQPSSLPTVRAGYRRTQMAQDRRPVLDASSHPAPIFAASARTRQQPQSRHFALVTARSSCRSPQATTTAVSASPCGYPVRRLHRAGRAGYAAAAGPSP